jgi:DNA polymerase I-like protein with 3'-5' exonuclease and polymerase domains
MARYDGGDYAAVVVDGDVHTVNQKAVGLYNRNSAKTWIYAFLYGAGDLKLGQIVLADYPADRRAAFYAEHGTSGLKCEKALKKLGAESRSKIAEGLPALGRLIKDIKAKARKQKFLLGLDGRYLECRAEHSSPNTLLQSAGALIMKRWLVILDERLQDKGLVPFEWRYKGSGGPAGDYEFVANVHDEAQTEIKNEAVETYDETAVESFPMAGDYYGFRAPIEGEGKMGSSWTYTH